MLSVVIPCFNEEPNIRRFEAELVPALEALGRPWEIVAVDDGSRDQTLAALRELAVKRPVQVLSHEANRGLGAALRTGFSAAKGDWIAALDADLTFHPSQLEALLDRQAETGADLVGGSPYLTAEGASGVPWVRRLPSIAINAFYRGLFGRGLTAYTPMFRLYRAETLKSLPLASDGFEISAEIAALFLRRGRKVAEAPVTLTERRAGVSKLDRWRELKRHALLVARLLKG